MKTVYYSMLLGRLHPGLYEHQWIQSIRSLRKHNRDIKVILFIWDNVLPPEIIYETEHQCVEIRQMGLYEELFSNMTEHKRKVLACYPVLHKFACLSHLPGDASEVLYLDCDTFFFRDPTLIFESHNTLDWYGREEPGSYRSNGNTLLDFYVSALASAERKAFLFPTNMGVVLFNSRWRELGGLSAHVFDTVHRFLLDISKREGRFATLGGIVNLNDVLPEQGEIPLRYPPFSVYAPWTVEQLALWHIWGEVPGLTQGLLARDLVRQGIDESLLNGGNPVMCHYYHLSEDRFFKRYSPLVG